MNSQARFITICLSMIISLIALTASSTVADQNAFGLEIHSGTNPVLFADYYPFESNQHWMVHIWFIPEAQSNIAFRYTAKVPGFDKLEFGTGACWSSVDDVEKVRFINYELVFNFPLGKNLLLKSYGLGQKPIDGISSDFGLIRNQLQIAQSRWAVFNQNQIQEASQPKFFLGLACDLAPLKCLSTCKLFVTVNVNDSQENFVGWIAEF